MLHSFNVLVLVWRNSMTIFNSMIDDVCIFQTRCEQLSLFDDAKPKDVCELYARLIREEYKELQDALLTNDKAHILNEALDLIWVTIGYCNAEGFNIDAAWRVLARANMAKLQHDPDTGKLLRNEHGKIQKPKDWKKPDYSSFV